MKVKLLKKVRKRYAITKVDSLASNACSTYKAATEEFGLPFYIFRDKEDDFGLYTRYFGALDDAYDYLKRSILADYREKFRHKDGKETKVWWK